MQTFETMLDEWEGISEQLDDLKRRELSLRTALCTAANPNPKIGTNKTPLNDGRIFKAIFKMNHYINSVDQKLLAQQLEEINVSPADVVDCPLQYSGRKYKEAPDEIKALLDARITSKMGQPKIEIT